MRRRLFAGMVLAFALATPGWAASPDEMAIEISREIMSPFCPGITLHDCPTRAAIELRERIEGWARDGWTKSRIVDRLVAEYGEPILALPDRPITTLLRWLPFVLLAAGGFIVLRSVLSWQRKDEPDPSFEQATAAERATLEAELNRLRTLP